MFKLWGERGIRLVQTKFSVITVIVWQIHVFHIPVGTIYHIPTGGKGEGAHIRKCWRGSLHCFGVKRVSRIKHCYLCCRDIFQGYTQRKM